MAKRKDTKAQIKVSRYDPSTGRRYDQTYEIPFDAGWSVINALVYIYEEVDSSLAVPYTCLQGRCMGCAVSMNGKAVSACSTPMKENMTIEALPHSPVIKDLVVEFRKAKIIYDPEKCSMCLLCVEACAINIWSMSDTHGLAEIVKDEVLCIGCRECETSCIEDAIRIEVVG